MPLQVKADILRFTKMEVEERLYAFFKSLRTFAKDRETKRNIQVASI